MYELDEKKISNFDTEQEQEFGQRFAKVRLTDETLFCQFGIYDIV